MSLASRRETAYLFKVVKRKCPTCRRSFQPSEETQPFRPFCSARCRAADLGKWLDGGYRIATPISDDSELDDGGGRPTPEEPGTKLPQ